MGFSTPSAQNAITWRCGSTPKILIADADSRTRGVMSKVESMKLCMAKYKVSGFPLLGIIVDDSLHLKAFVLDKSVDIKEHQRVERI